MRVLALADKPPPMDPALMARKLGVHPVAGLAQTSYGDARVHWISGARVVLLD